MRIKQIFTALVIVLLMAVAGCKTTPKDVLTRKWKATDATGSMMTPEMKKQIVAEGNTIEFMKDGKYIAWSKGKEDDKGTYTLSEDGKTLTTKTSGDGPNQTINVKELTQDKMIADMGVIVITFEPSK